MYGIQKQSTKQKSFILIAQIVYLIIAYYVLFSLNEENFLSIGLFTALFITSLRLNAMMFLWLPRGIGWMEAIGNSLAFALYYLVFPLLAIANDNDASMTLFMVGWIIFLLGSFINTGSELLRKTFKDNPENKGKLYTGGLFHYAIHINYFGDCLWVLGLAILTNNFFSLFIPLGLLLLFVTSYIPNHDKYLQDKYGDQFIEYKKSTKKLIPFIW
ncbi:methyltransferase family protein [Gracilibacillus dipsosauri]|uniref:methyltransferase family protein n=1 Tax=Gracilibacillus dipsosauri TaxID=178340 RepID=UPI0024096EF5